MRDIRKDTWGEPPRGIRQRDLPPPGGTPYVNRLKREVERRIADGTISEGEEADEIDDYGMDQQRRKAWARKVKVARRRASA